jgi:hypothetical protein
MPNYSSGRVPNLRGDGRSRRNWRRSGKKPRLLPAETKLMSAEIAGEGHCGAAGEAMNALIALKAP